MEKQSGIPFAEVLCKNRYVGRTFIQPSTRLRKLGVAKKFGVLADNVKGKSVILIDDSIVRGNTIGQIVKLLKTAGATKVRNIFNGINWNSSRKARACRLVLGSLMTFRSNATFTFSYLMFEKGRYVYVPVFL